MRCAFALAAVLVATFSHAAQAQTLRRTVAPGQEVVIATPYSFNARDCTHGQAVVDFTRRPTMGTAFTRPATSVVRRTSTSRGSQFGRCLGETVRSTAIVYRAGPSRGQDSFSYLLYLGMTRNPRDVVITIR